ncbi:MAG: ATP-binding protein [Pseudomonas sp.]|uniref:ATP-binding protein n=1 Tax=Pseudomonas sp. TaxID=306 RepID=UPI0027325DC3|nr:ATP-binding protein [Pseudomonas sp.]MDP3848174.1 ATP-binding protein [Pseudomonas sp.]
MTDKKPFWSLFPRSTSLRPTLFLGAGLGILLPALVLGYIQLTSKFTDDVLLRVRAPMQQSADVLSHGMAVAIWNVDREVAARLMDAVLRNPDVSSITVTNEYQDTFASKQNPQTETAGLLREERDITYNGTPIGHLVLEFSTARIERERWSDLFKLACALLAQVAISFIVIWRLFDRRMLRPLQALQQGAQRLARGELEQPLHWQREDEIGQLAQGLDQMRGDLAALLSEREQKNAALQTELAERQRIEVALGLSQAKFAAIFNASPVSMSVSRMDEGMTLLDVNAPWVRLFKRERATILGNDTHNMWRSLEERQTALITLQQTGELSRCTAWLQRGGGQDDILCEIWGKVIKLRDESLLILAYDDITAKHLYEENILALNVSLEQRVIERTAELSTALEQLTVTQTELRRSEKMSSLGSLVAGIAHELNTPIGNSLTVASTLQHHAEVFANNMDKGMTRSHLNEFVSSTRQGADILMRGLQQAAELVASFKQVAVDQASEKRRWFSLGDTVREVLLTLGPTLRKTNHRIDCQISADIQMDSYPGALTQIISNLINNALVHAFVGREYGTVTINAQLHGNGVELIIRDDGVGIPEANLSRVFDPFFTTRLGQGGSGLGLNIAYNLTQDVLGGSIEVSSTEGHGACFSLRLPLLAPQIKPEH